MGHSFARSVCSASLSAFEIQALNELPLYHKLGTQTPRELCTLNTFPHRKEKYDIKEVFFRLNNYNLIQLNIKCSNIKNTELVSFTENNNSVNSNNQFKYMYK